MISKALFTGLSIIVTEKPKTNKNITRQTENRKKSAVLQHEATE